MATETPQEKIARLEKENAQLAEWKKTHEIERANPQALRLKKTEKGGLSVYNLGRFPVTLYKEQWLRLLEISDRIKAEVKDLPDKKKD